MKVTFRGLRRMDAAIAGHVRNTGQDLTVWNRTPKEFAGATIARSVAEAVQDVDRRSSSSGTHGVEEWWPSMSCNTSATHSPSS